MKFETDVKKIESLMCVIKSAYYNTKNDKVAESHAQKYRVLSLEKQLIIQEKKTYSLLF